MGLAVSAAIAPVRTRRHLRHVVEAVRGPSQSSAAYPGCDHGLARLLSISDGPDRDLRAVEAPIDPPVVEEQRRSVAHRVEGCVLEMEETAT